MKKQDAQQPAVPGVPKSVKIAQAGVYTSGQFCALMSSLMSDLLTGEVTPQCGNAVVNAGGKLLKTVELEQKYGTTGSDGTSKTLALVSQSTQPSIAA